MSSTSSISRISSPCVHNHLHIPSSSSPQTTRMAFPRKRTCRRPRTAVTAMAVVVSILSTSLVSVAAAFHHTSLAFVTPPPTRRQSSYSSSSTFIQAIAEQEQVLLKKSASSRQRQQRQSLKNRNNLERLYSLPVVEHLPEDENEYEFRFDEETMEQRQRQMTRSMKMKTQTATLTSSSSSSLTSPSSVTPLVKVVRGRKMDSSSTPRRSASMKTATTPLRMKSPRMAMKKADASTATAAAATATLEEDAHSSSSTVQFKGLSTTSYRGNRKFLPPLPPTNSAAAASRPTITSNTTMTILAAATGDSTYSSSSTTATATTRTRSSTMPGFAGQSDKQRAFRDGVRLAELQSGRKFVDTPESFQSRRRINGENMYKNSASVPDSLTQFAHEIHQEGRITRQEEIQLGTTVQEAIRLHRNLEALRLELGREATDEEWCAAAGKINMQAIREAMDEGLQAKNKLVTSNLRMVQSVVNTYIRNGLSAQYNAGDLMQEGILALIRAAEKFEPDRGWKFSTYAMYWVRASVKRNQVYQSRVINVPQRLYESHKRLLRVNTELEVVLGRKPTNHELGQAVGMTAEQVKRCLAAMEQRCYSLDQEIRNSKKPITLNNKKNRLIDIMDSKSPDDNMQKMQFIREDIIETLNRQLTPEEVELLLYRYGLKDLPGSKKTLGSSGQPTIAELSRVVGLKPDKVRRIINRALQQLRSVQSDEWLALERELLR